MGKAEKGSLMINIPAKLEKYFSVVVFAVLAAFSSGCADSGKDQAESKMLSANENVSFMSVEELMREPKIDAHAHFMALAAEDEKKFVAMLNKHNMTWLTICTVGMDWTNLQKQN